MEDGDEKPLEPTQKRLEDARKKGEIIRSQELNIFILYASFVFIIYTIGNSFLQNSLLYMQHILILAANNADLFFGKNTQVEVLSMIKGILLAFFPIIGFSLLLLMASLILQKGIIFVRSNINFKLDRISVLAGLKKKFGANGIFEFLKSTVKLCIYTITFLCFLSFSLDNIVAMSFLNSTIGIVHILKGCLFLLFLCLVVSLILALIDYTWQRNQFFKKQRMSLQEVKDEYRESEGDPHLKGVRRQRAVDIATNNMLKDIPKADVVIVNPTHVAVVLRWDRSIDKAPVLVAKGYNDIALRIRSIATEHSIPIFEDILTARQLCATLKIGEEIKNTHYEAVAAAVRFAQKFYERRK